jgi:hypothetical protein
MTVRTPIRLLLAAPLGVLAAVLVSCGSSGAGLIPAEDAGPLLADFQAVEAAAKAGNGSCSATAAAIHRTESALERLPASVDAGLHGRLQEGVSKLRELALETCAQPTSQTTTAESTPPAKTAPPSTTATTGTPTTGTSTTSTSPTETTSTTGTTPGATQPSGTEGGTAPEVGGSSESPAAEAGGSGSGEAAKNGGASGGTGSGGNGQ